MDRKKNVFFNIDSLKIVNMPDPRIPKPRPPGR